MFFYRNYTIGETKVSLNSITKTFKEDDLYEENHITGI